MVMNRQSRFSGLDLLLLLLESESDSDLEAFRGTIKAKVHILPAQSLHLDVLGRPSNLPSSAGSGSHQNH